MNKLAKIENNRIVYNTNVNNIVIGDRRIFNPTQQQYRQAGFTDLPTIQHTEDQIVYYVIENNQIVAKIRQSIQIPTKYSKLKIIQNTQKSGVQWSVVEQWMKQNGLYSRWMAAQELSSDYEGFSDIIALIKNTFPNSNVDQILQKSIM